MRHPGALYGNKILCCQSSIHLHLFKYLLSYSNTYSLEVYGSQTNMQTQLWRLNAALLVKQKREAKACLEAAGKLWENMHSNQTYARRKEDDVYKVPV